MGSEMAGKAQRFAALLLVLLAINPPASAAAAWDLARLVATVSEAGFGTYRFTEERHLRYLTEPLRLEGTLSYTADGRLIRQVTSPRRERAVIEGNLLSIETSQVDRPVRVPLSGQPVLNALVIALRATLAGDAELLAEHFEVDLSGSEEEWTLRLTPRSERLNEAVRGLRIEGRSREIRVIEIVETGGDRSVVTISGKL